MCSYMTCVYTKEFSVAHVLNHDSSSNSDRRSKYTSLPELLKSCELSFPFPPSSVANVFAIQVRRDTCESVAVSIAIDGYRSARDRARVRSPVRLKPRCYANSVIILGIFHPLVTPSLFFSFSLCLYLLLVFRSGSSLFSLLRDCTQCSVTTVQSQNMF